MNLPTAAGLAQDEHEGLSINFRVIVPDMRDIVFRSCDSMESEIEVLTFPEGGRLGAPRTARGQQRGSRISFSQGSATTGSGGRMIFDWFLEVCDGAKPLTKRTLSVIVTDSNGKDIAEWRIKNAWPCRWVAPVMSVDMAKLTVEQVTFACEGVERKK